MKKRLEEVHVSLQVGSKNWWKSIYLRYICSCVEFLEPTLSSVCCNDEGVSCLGIGCVTKERFHIFYFVSAISMVCRCSFTVSLMPPCFPASLAHRSICFFASS